MIRFLSIASLWIASVAADEADTCGLYLAVSSTSTADATTWGLYAGEVIPAHTPIGFPEIAVNLLHLQANAAYDDSDEDRSAVVDFLESQVWVPDAAGAKFALKNGRIVTSIPGAGALGGFNPKLTNAAWNHHEAYRHPSVGEEPGVAHVNRGAQSDYYHVVLQTTSEIPAGMEVFVDFGENWEDDDKENELQKEDYEKVDKTVEQMIAFFEKHKGALDEESKSKVYMFIVRDVLNAAVGQAKARKIGAILPTNPDDLPKVMEAGGSLSYSAPSVYRQLSWLAKHGLCMDNIKPGASHIPHAGRGAFATRAIPQGGLVTPVPLVHLPYKDILDMHNLEADEEGFYTRTSDEVINQQLLTNYVYGHPSSTMVFVPSGSTASFINHSKEPNARMQWSTHPAHQKAWFDLDPSELVQEEHLYLGLMMEIVALRDIAPDEEIVMDYGEEWQEAWEEHVKRWEGMELPTAWPIRANDMNQKVHYEGQPFKTPEELKEEPYPENLSLVAFLMIVDSDNAGTEEDPKEWGEPEDGTTYDAENLFSLEIMSREEEEGSYTYVVEWKNNKGQSTYVTGVPHDAIIFVDNPESGDQFMNGLSFRHYIGIPDDVFPQGAWRNLS